MSTLTFKSSQISLLLHLKSKALSNFCQTTCRLLKQPFVEGNKGTFQGKQTTTGSHLMISLPFPPPPLSLNSLH